MMMMVNVMMMVVTIIAPEMISNMILHAAFEGAVNAAEVNEPSSGFECLDVESVR